MKERNIGIGWNSNQYIKFEKERTQPSVDLINRIDTVPDSILDIGCGPGNSTQMLKNAFPDAEILGIDNSDDMLEKAKLVHPDLQFEKCEIPDELNRLGKFDLIFSNACLHWIPDHNVLLPKLMGKLNDEGITAVQMPLVQDALFYRLLGQLVSSEKWEDLRIIKNFHNLSPEKTYDILASVCKDVTMWETAYYHAVDTHESVIEWYKGSGLKPYLDALDPARREEFLKELLCIIKQNYPVRADGKIILKMPRLFFIAHK